MNGSIRWVNSVETASRDVTDSWDLADITGEIWRLSQKYEVVWARLTDSTGKVWFVESNGGKVVWIPLRHDKDSRPVKDGIW